MVQCNHSMVTIHTWGGGPPGGVFFRKGSTFKSRRSEQLLVEIVRFSFVELDDPSGTLSILWEYFCPRRISRQYLRRIWRPCFYPILFLSRSSQRRLINPHKIFAIFAEEYLGNIFGVEYFLGFLFCEYDLQGIFSDGKDFWPIFAEEYFIARKNFVLNLKSNLCQICLTEL